MLHVGHGFGMGGVEAIIFFILVSPWFGLIVCNPGPYGVPFPIMQYPVRMFSVESASVADHKCAYPYARNVSGLFYLLKCLFQAFREPFARFQPVAYGGAVSYVQLKIPDFFAACQLGKAFQVFFQLYSVKVLVAVIPGAPVIGLRHKESDRHVSADFFRCFFQAFFHGRGQEEPEPFKNDLFPSGIFHPCADR